MKWADFFKGFFATIGAVAMLLIGVTIVVVFGPVFQAYPYPTAAIVVLLVAIAIGWAYAADMRDIKKPKPLE